MSTTSDLWTPHTQRHSPVISHTTQSQLTVAVTRGTPRLMEYLVEHASMSLSLTLPPPSLCPCYCARPRTNLSSDSDVG